MAHQVLLGILGAGGLVFLLGLLLLSLARRADRRNWFVQRAPKLPIRLVQPADDAWVTGEVDCPSPIHIPYFHIPCVYYSYRVEEKVERTRRRRDGKTETYTTWETQSTDSDVTRCRLVDGEDSLEIRTEDATFADLEWTGTDYETSDRRHSARYFPPSAAAGAVGLVDDTGKALGKGEFIPLVMVRRSRADYLRGIEASERAKRVSGMVVSWIGLSAMAFAGGGSLGWIRPASHWTDLILQIGLAALAGLVPLAVFWAIYTYNTLVAYRTRTVNAWRLIDIDLKNRYDLIPQLVAVIRKACEHERELIEWIATLRSGYVEGSIASKVDQESDAMRVVSRVLGLVESYPQLTSNDLFQQLSNTLKALEEKIAHDRNFYNDNTTEYNTLLQTFPEVLVARIAKFESFPLFAIGSE